jgi:hypothetical protein
MTQSELVSELATRAGVSRADAAAVLDALADVACEQARLGTPVSLAGFGAPGDGAADVLAPAGGSEPSARPAYADSGAPIVGEAPCVPSSREVDDLIAAAAIHPLGIEFLLTGQIGAVAITFNTHAFTVEAARQRFSAAAPGAAEPTP